MKRPGVFGWCVVAVLWAAAPTSGEPLPETGTFEDVYHLDRWDRASVGFCVVPPDLRNRFAGLEGRPVPSRPRSRSTSVPRTTRLDRR